MDCDIVHGILNVYGLSFSDARRLLSREHYQEGTVEFHKAMKVKMMICKAEINEMYSARDALARDALARDVTEELQTPPLSRR